MKKFYNHQSYSTIPETPFRFLGFCCQEQKLIFTVLALTALLWAFNQNFFPLFIKLVVNTYFNTGENTGVLKLNNFTLSIILISELILILAAMRLQGVLAAKAMPTLCANIRKKIYLCISHYQYSYFINQPAGIISAKINEIAGSSEKILQILLFHILSVFLSFLVSFTLLIFVQAILAWILLFWFCLHIGLSIYFIKNSEKPAKKYAESYSALKVLLNDIFSNFANVRIFNRHQDEYQNFCVAQTKEVQAARALQTRFEWMKLVLGILATGLISGEIILILYFFKQQQASLGDVALVAIISFSTMNIVWQLSLQINQFMREYSILKSALSIIDRRYQQISSDKTEVLLNPDFAQIEFKNVSFSFNNFARLFNQVSFLIRSGEKILIKGESGSGKTSLIYLLFGWLNPLEGKILIQGNSSECLEIPTRKQLISCAIQEALIFQRSVKNNISYSKPTASFDEIVAAAKVACCHDFIMQLENGYDTILGERNTKLSGGQQQRIALARAILSDAKIIILDEATSALDFATEEKIYAKLFNYLKDKTLLVITHRQQMQAKFDRLLEIKQGKIHEVFSDANLTLIDSRN